MYTLLKTISLRRIAFEQLPAIGTAWLTAEFFYKFGSFTMELAAFLATWFIADAILQFLLSSMRRTASQER